MSLHMQVKDLVIFLTGFSDLFHRRGHGARYLPLRRSS